MSNESSLPAGRRELLASLNRYSQPYPVYPLGLAYLQGGLRAAGYRTKIWDANVSTGTLESCIATFEPAYIALSMRNIDNVQYHNPRSFVGELLDCCRRIRSVTTARLILGGSGFSIFPKELFAMADVDYGIVGDGEVSLVRLLQAIECGGGLDGVSGLLHREAADAIQINPFSARDAAFCTEPVHDPELLRAYAARGALPGVQTQRGCPLRCCYCTYPLIEGRRSRYRTGQNVVREMRKLLSLGVSFTFIVDSVFNTCVDHVVEVCEAGHARVEYGIDDDRETHPERQQFPHLPHDILAGPVSAPPPLDERIGAIAAPQGASALGLHAGQGPPRGVGPKQFRVVHGLGAERGVPGAEGIDLNRIGSLPVKQARNAVKAAAAFDSLEQPDKRDFAISHDAVVHVSHCEKLLGKNGEAASTQDQAGSG